MATSWCCSFSYMAKMKPCEHSLSQLFMQLAQHIFSYHNDISAEFGNDSGQLQNMALRGRGSFN